MKNYYCHPLALVESNEIGEGTRVWAFSHILPGAKIGENCNICDHTYLENNVMIGNHVTIKSGVYLWEGVKLEDHTFIGPNVTFTNDLKPRSKKYLSRYENTLVQKGATIGANSTIIAGNSIGEYAMIGAGSVVTKNIPQYTLWYGNPAQFKGYVCKCGELLDKDLNCVSCDETYQMKNGVVTRNLNEERGSE